MVDVHKMIRVVYTWHSAGGWHLAGMESSSGVRKLFMMPDFNPASSDPKRQHLRDLFEALNAAGLEGRKSREVCEGQRHEIVLYISRIPPVIEKKRSRENDEDYLALQQLQAESRARLSTEEDSQRWKKICHKRAWAPRMLGSRTRRKKR